MNLFLAIINGIYRVWFYLLIAIATILLMPFLFVFTIKETFYPYFYKVARTWSKIILYGMGLFPKVKKQAEPKLGKSYVLVANHSSMIDIMLMFAVIKNPFVFVGKKELAKLPVFGFFYKRSSILVDRQNLRSRNAVFKQAQRRLNQGNSICIFPEGGVPKDDTLILGRFKDGAFRMAIDHQKPIFPLIFYDNKIRFPYTFKKAKWGRLRVKILSPFSTEGLDKRKDKATLRNEVREKMLKEITEIGF